jgi:hypothetical protein
VRYYTVHLPRALRLGAAEGEGLPGAGQALGGALLVRDGFSWLAFFLSLPWALAHGLWFGAIAMAAALAVIVGVPEIFAPDWSIRAVLLVGYALFCGFNGNDWRRLGLEQSGWELAGTVAARDRDHAFLRLARRLGEDDEAVPSATPAAPPARPQPAGPKLDIGPTPGFWS